MIDSHCHLNHPYFKDDFEAVLAHAVTDGVRGFVNIGFDRESIRETMALLEKYPFFYGVVGVHPQDATKCDDALVAEITRLLSHPRVVAVGEIGLDFHYENSPRDVQVDVFRRMLALARQHDLPFVIHCRDAFDEVIAELENAGPPHRGIFHAFGGDAGEAARIRELGLHLGIGGVATFKNSRLQAALPDLPADALVIETDSPYLTPHPFRGKRNESAYVRFTARAVAAAHGMSLAAVSDLTTTNWLRAVGLGPESLPAPVYKIGKCDYIHIAHPEAGDALSRLEGTSEVVMCGLGEPLLHAGLIRDFAGRAARTVVVTGGTAGTDAIGAIADSIDELSVTLYGGTPVQHERWVDEGGFEGIIEFVKQAVRAGIHTVCNFIAIPKQKLEPCRELAESLGAEFRSRPYRGLD